MVRKDHEMLVDAHWPPPEPEPDRPSFRWPRAAWPVLTVVFMAAIHLTPPVIAYLCVIGALYCAVETFGLLLPRSSDGLRDHKQ
jgi:hypothetical protein